MNRFAKAYELTCETCGNKYILTQNECIDLLMKIVPKKKDITVEEFLNMTAGCCKNLIIRKR